MSIGAFAFVSVVLVAAGILIGNIIGNVALPIIQAVQRWFNPEE